MITIDNKNKQIIVPKTMSTKQIKKELEKIMALDPQTIKTYIVIKK